MENNNVNITVTEQRKRSPSQVNCRLLRITPLICVIAGCFLTVVGHIASLKSCEIAGPVVITVGGLLLVFLTFWSSRRNLYHTEGASANGEEVVNTPQALSDKCSNEQIAEMGSIHHFEIWIPAESCLSNEMVPPSYDEAVSNNNTKNLQDGSVMCVNQGFSSDNTPSDPPLS